MFGNVSCASRSLLAVLPWLHLTPRHVCVAFAMPGLVKKDHMYSRLSNPNRDGFEACLASLEGGKRTLTGSLSLDVGIRVRLHACV